MLIQWISFKSHWTKECDRGVLVVEHVLPINDPNTCKGKYSDYVALFPLYFDLLPRRSQVMLVIIQNGLSQKASNVVLL